nr:endonuclease NucS domain-containing protein [Paenibacillus qinlingensis]
MIENLDLYFGLEFVAKEYRINNSYRVDILGREGDNFYIIELKKEIADISAFNQIKRYLTAFKRQTGKSAFGYIASPRVDELTKLACLHDEKIRAVELQNFKYIPTTRPTFVRPVLKEILTDRGITHKKLSEMSGVPQAALSRFDKTHSHNATHMFAIARALNIPVEKLFKIYEEQEG